MGDRYSIGDHMKRLRNEAEKAEDIAQTRQLFRDMPSFPEKKFEDMTMSEQMVQLRSEAVEDHKGYIVADCNKGLAAEYNSNLIINVNDYHAGVGLRTGELAVMGGNLTGKSVLGAEAARTLKLMGLQAKTNRDNDKIDPGYLYELLNQLKNQLDREKPNRKKANNIFSKFRREIGDHVTFIKQTLREVKVLDTGIKTRDETIRKVREEKNKLSKSNDLHKNETTRLQIENAELERKLACFEEDGEVAKIRSKLVNVVRKQV